MSNKDISCHDALRSVYEYLDGELTEENSEAVQAHFEVCQRCYPHLRFTASFRDALHRAAQGQDHAPAELREKIGALLKEEGVDL